MSFPARDGVMETATGPMLLAVEAVAEAQAVIAEAARLARRNCRDDQRRPLRGPTSGCAGTRRPPDRSVRARRRRDCLCGAQVSRQPDRDGCLETLMAGTASLWKRVSASAAAL